MSNGSFLYIYICYIQKLYILILLYMPKGVDIVKTLKDFYEQRKKEIKMFPAMLYSFSKPKHREPLTEKEQEILNKYVHQVYNPRIKKLKEADYFMEEFMEPETGAYA